MSELSFYYEIFLKMFSIHLCNIQTISASKQFISSISKQNQSNIYVTNRRKRRKLFLLHFVHSNTEVFGNLFTSWGLILHYVDLININQLEKSTNFLLFVKFTFYLLILLRIAYIEINATNLIVWYPFLTSGTGIYQFLAVIQKKIYLKK